MASSSGAEEDANGETASFDRQRNVQLDLRKMQLPITHLDHGARESQPEAAVRGRKPS